MIVGWQPQIVFKKPEQGLAHRPELNDLSEHKINGFLYSPVRILFQPVVIRFDVTQLVHR
jgi:hypothetical protein